ncbi:hypothetical protein [Salinispora mooreana]|uniref:hypothetical protein n=1 Tax=Salinispora mooreana TaxID=999545 RepID=UPI00037AABBE|nr:hypothetical protein [Salinispora mooreana]
MNANELLMGGGVKSAAFPTVGTCVSGRVVREPEARQQTTPEGVAKTFDNGDPMMQIIVQVHTDERDPQDADDDGVRALYIKGNMLSAVRDAVRKSGAKGIEVGATLTVTYTGDGEKKRAAWSAPKLYSATYTAPPAPASNILMGQPTTPAPQAVPAVTPPADTAPAGVDPALWAQMSTDQRAKLRAAMGQ